MAGDVALKMGKNVIIKNDPKVYLESIAMTTITKKELIDQISEKTNNKRVVVKRIIQAFLDDIIEELGKDNRLEFRDFGVFETKRRAARVAQNPKTLERVSVPPKRTVKFKVGRLMKMRLHDQDMKEAQQMQAGVPERQAEMQSGY